MATTYTVKKGDTLTKIASNHNTTVAKLVLLNDISNPDYIVVGQVLQINGVKTTPPKTVSTVAKVKTFGLQSNSDRTIYATWTWDRTNTKEYKVRWWYNTGDGVWFGPDESTVKYKQATYNAPANAISVKFKMIPIATTHKVAGKDTAYWTAEWTKDSIYTFSDTLSSAPPVPTVTMKNLTLTAEVQNLKDDPSIIQFQVVRDDTNAYKTEKVKVKTASASYTCTVLAGSNYKVRCRGIKNDIYSEWSDYSANNGTIPSAVKTLTKCEAKSNTSVYLEWPAVTNATSYDIEYTEDKTLFDGSNGTTTVNDVKTPHYEQTGLETGKAYFFRVRAINNQGQSGWSEVKSVTIGTGPVAPTTWSSTTTVVTGEPLTLYWVHNTQDGSSQTFAELELTIDGITETHTIQNSTKEDEKDKTSFYKVDTSGYSEGTQILWRVRTAGITKVYGEWSVQRTVTVYAPPTLELNVTDADGNSLDDTVVSFPFYISATPGPITQTPLSYHVSITSDDTYTTYDGAGNYVTVYPGGEVYSKHFDISKDLLIEMTPSNIDLENGYTYYVTCVVSMDSGLTATARREFYVDWSDIPIAPNAEITVDEETYSAHIRPYCEHYPRIHYRVTNETGVYIRTAEVIDPIDGIGIDNTLTATGEQVYTGTTNSGSSVYFCVVYADNPVLANDVTLAVYRREFDGCFTEIASGIDNTGKTFVVDPHPSLDYARYRIVATSNITGTVSYSDIPGYPVGGNAVIIQWDEVWSSFDTTNEDPLEEPPWSGSLLKLMYNIDISTKHNTDVEFVEYIGRRSPVSYYGTQLGESATWNMEIDREDTETLYALRRLAVWSGDVYVREPSGSGYWANVTVSFSQKHREVTIPVTIF